MARSPRYAASEGGGGRRRPTDLGANAPKLLEDFFEPVAGALCAQRRVDSRNETGRHVVLGCADCDARSERRNGTLAVTGNYLKVRIPAGRVRNESMSVVADRSAAPE